MLEERVNIQYSIDIEELPKEVERLIEKACCALEEVCSTDMQEAVKSSDSLSLSTLTSVEQIRKKLAGVDYILNDVSQIVNGFISFKVQEAQRAHQAPQSTQHEEGPMPPMAMHPGSMPDMESLTEEAVKNVNVDALQERLNELRTKQQSVE